VEGGIDEPPAAAPPAPSDSRVATGPVVTFPDPNLVAQVAAIEAEQPQQALAFRWAPSIIFALLFAFAGGAIFAAVAYITKSQFGIVSILIGIGAGIGAARGGRGVKAQVIGALAAAVGYFAGQLMAVAALVGMKFFQLPFSMILDVIKLMVEQTFTTMDALFLGIAVYEGWIIPKVRT
jgi:hypothetical protein